jgi:hypothetical protein
LLVPPLLLPPSFVVPPLLLPPSFVVPAAGSLPPTPVPPLPSGGSAKVTSPLLEQESTNAEAPSNPKTDFILIRFLNNGEKTVKSRLAALRPA